MWGNNWHSAATRVYCLYVHAYYIMLETNIENSKGQQEIVGPPPPGRSKSIWRFSTRTCPIHELTRPPTSELSRSGNCNCNCNRKCPTGIGLRLRLSWHLTLIGHNLNSARERHELYLTFLALPKLEVGGKFHLILFRFLKTATTATAQTSAQTSLYVAERALSASQFWA